MQNFKYVFINKNKIYRIVKLILRKRIEIQLYWFSRKVSNEFDKVIFNSKIN